MKGIVPQERLEKWNEAICAQKTSRFTIKEWCGQNEINSNICYYLRNFFLIFLNDT